MTLMMTSVMSVDEIRAELDEICERVEAEVSEVSPAVFTACPSYILWMCPEDRQRRHDLIMEFQSRGGQLQSEARQRNLARRAERKIQRANL